MVRGLEVSGERLEVSGERLEVSDFIHFLPLRQGEYPKGEGVDWVFREMTKCHFVPHEGSTTQCDAGPTRRGRGWIGSGEW